MCLSVTCLYLSHYTFFFFKPKTSYEMRISDWSSDVCSSDLLDVAVLHGDLDAETAELAFRLHLHVAEILRVQVARMRVERREHPVDRRFDELLVGDRLDVVGPDPLEHVAEQEIGRASCRERVCQYV